MMVEDEIRRRLDWDERVFGDFGDPELVREAREEIRTDVILQAAAEERRRLRSYRGRE